ncbi:hypothetical protein PR048_028962 [Dryococelus australis]|uniref:Uncharacterized protein n=1 Tax=Dryococelus australis TaxID=614101 RepID=A0ABQ9GEJ7_9NEOP|nr:hypothetical protein PR048_028962 [Dryococelus australis]
MVESLIPPPDTAMVECLGISYRPNCIYSKTWTSSCNGQLVADSCKCNWVRHSTQGIDQPQQDVSLEPTNPSYSSDENKQTEQERNKMRPGSNFDIELLNELVPTLDQIERAVLLGTSPNPSAFSPDEDGHNFPISIL